MHSTAVHPGVIKTNLGRHLDPALFQQMTSAMGPHFKSAEQGAATTVWAAIAREWEGTGGKFLENCSVSKPFNPEKDASVVGHLPHAYSQESAERLWELSNKLVGVSD